jgi:hypothetical protein
MYVTPDETMKKVAHKLNYRGRRFQVSSQVPKVLASYWSGGHKKFFYFYDPRTDTLAAVDDSPHPEVQLKTHKLDSLPDGILLVQNTFVNGEDYGLTFYANPTTLAPLLTVSTMVLTHDEQIVLFSTARHISSYRYEYCWDRHSMTRSTYELTKQNLICKGLLNARGALTLAGKNAAQSLDYATL